MPQENGAQMNEYKFQKILDSSTRNCSESLNNIFKLVLNAQVNFTQQRVGKKPWGIVLAWITIESYTP